MTDDLSNHDQHRTSPTRVLLISAGPVGQHLAGPAIRSIELARALARAGMRVTLLTPNRTPQPKYEFNVESHGGSQEVAVRALKAHDVLVCQGYTLVQMPALVRLEKCLVLDLYDPFPLENLHVHRHRSYDERERMAATDIALLNAQLLVGDFFICANERQRDFWLGLLAANGRLSARSFDLDPSFQRLIQIVPFGVSPERPVWKAPVMKGAMPGIAEDDEVVLWAGGAWDWMDPLAAVQAMAILQSKRPRARLVFMGIRSPDASIQGGSAVRIAQRMATRLQLNQRSVFFRDWTSYAERAGFLIEADVGLSLSANHLESRFAMRSRLLDFVWAGLPAVLSDGDSLADELEAAGVATLVEPSNPGSVANAIERLLEAGRRHELASAFTRLRDKFSWDHAAEPLIRYCRSPERAPDNRLDRERFQRWPDLASIPTVQLIGPWWKLPFRAIEHFRNGGLKTLRLATADHLRRRRLGATRGR